MCSEKPFWRYKLKKTNTPIISMLRIMLFYEDIALNCLLMKSYLNACDVTIAHSNHTNFLKQLCPPLWKRFRHSWEWRPIYTEELPGVAAHDSLFVLLRPGVAVPSRARAQNATKQTENRARLLATPQCRLALTVCMRNWRRSPTARPSVQVTMETATKHFSTKADLAYLLGPALVLQRTRDKVNVCSP